MFKSAPASAMPEMAEFYLRTNYRETGLRGNFPEAIEEWSLVDPVAVSLFFDQHAGNPAIQGNFDTLLFQWARLDPEAARNWFQRQKPFPATEDGKRYFSEAVHGFIFGWFNNEKSAALDFAVSNASNEAFEETIHSLTLSLFLKSDEDSTKFIERLPSESRAKAVESAARYTTTGVFLGYQDPKDKRSAETMTKWIVTLPEEAWGDTLGTVAMLWGKDDPAGFSAWFAQQSSQTKDQILYEQCTPSSHENPDEVLEQAKNISNPGLREKALVTYASSFGTTPAESIKLIRKTNLADHQKAYLIRLVQEYRKDDNGE